MNDINHILDDVLKEIDEEILEYDGANLIEEGLIDSFAIVTMLTLLEDRLNISISPEDVKEDNFKTYKCIVELLNKYIKE